MLEYARKLLLARGGKQRLVAFCLRKGRIVSIGYNSYNKTHPMQKKYASRVGKPGAEYLHAEVAALLKARDADEMFVARIDKRGNFALAKPCPICDLAISTYGITKINYTH